MKRVLFLSIISLISYNAQAQRIQDTTKYYSFEINYWFNLHHFLWLESFLNVNEDSTIINQVLTNGAQKQLDQALEYYEKNLIQLDLRTSDYMTEFKHWITKQEGKSQIIPPQFQQHFDLLNSVSDVYGKYFWPTHAEACKKILSDNIALIRQTERKFVENITKLTRQFWQAEKLTVDVTYVGKATKRNPRNLPYTSIFPTHVVMNALEENQPKGNWIELLYHESAHHLILGSSYFVGGTINDLTEVMDIEPPRQLGHSYLFYFTGELTKQFLNELGVIYTNTYMVRNGVFSRYFPLLDKYLKSYMNREMTLAQATRYIIEGLE